jgi:hypothetical protein
MSGYELNTPVSLLIFKRPNTTEKVFRAIREARPPKLLVVADGPRADRPDEARKCAMTREIIERVDWDCEVLTNYSDVNLGCKRRVSSGLDWVFGEVEEAIVLEDDCVPHPTFFRYCEELLNRYRDDERIVSISGDNFQFGRRRTEYSYYFSRYEHVWGWATWARAWEKNDVNMKLWPEVREGGWLKDILQDNRAVQDWSAIFENTYQNRIDSWDYAWVFSCWIQNGLSILPNINLVSNIGFGSEGTHTLEESPLGNLAARPMNFPLLHPPFVVRDARADSFTQHKVLTPAFTERAKRKATKLINRFKNVAASR